MNRLSAPWCRHRLQLDLVGVVLLYKNHMTKHYKVCLMYVCGRSDGKHLTGGIS